MDLEPLDDAALVARLADAPEAFAVLYRRYERPILAYLVRRLRDPDLAADIAAETFASALASLRRGTTPRGEFAGWLFGIARNMLADSWRRGYADDAARRTLAMQPLELDDAAAAAIARLADDDGVAQLVAALPEDQREAVTARILDDRDYREIATELDCSEAVVRKRVSRGLATLRTRLEGTSR